MYWGPIFLRRNPLSPLGQQSWTKSVVENFALSYPQNAYPAIMVPLWPLPSPLPGQICLVGIRNDPAGLLLFFGGGGGWRRGEGWLGGVFVVTSAFKSFILKLDMGNSIFLNIFVQD